MATAKGEAEGTICGKAAGDWPKARELDVGGVGDEAEAGVVD